MLRTRALEWLRWVLLLLRFKSPEKRKTFERDKENQVHDRFADFKIFLRGFISPRLDGAVTCLKLKLAKSS